MADVYRCLVIYEAEDGAVAFLSIHLGKKMFRAEAERFWQLSTCYFLLRVIITRRKKFYNKVE